MGRHDISILDASTVETMGDRSAPDATPSTRTWEEVFARPTALRVTALNTGSVLAGPSILIEAGPRTPEALLHDQWVPAIAYLVEHPTAGRMLFDAGVATPDASGHCDFGRWPLFNVPCRSAAGQGVVDQLAARGLTPKDLRFVAVSHFHGDHAGGLHALMKKAPVPVLTTSEEWSEVNRTFPALHGYLTEVIGGSYPIKTLPMGRSVTMPLVGRVVDLFGDGSIWLLPAAGHTRGQFAALLNVAGAASGGGPILLTFDAAHLAASVELDIPPGFVVDREAAVATVGRLRALRAAYPFIRFVYGHEPSQWSGKPRAVPLTHAM